MQTIITNVSVSKYTLSPNAARSIADINTATINKFAPRQAELYLSNLRDRFKFLVAQPELGIVRDDIKKGYYYYFEGSHAIYNKIIDERIAIIDIVRQSMEPTHHLSLKKYTDWLALQIDTTLCAYCSAESIIYDAEAIAALKFNAMAMITTISSPDALKK